MSIIENQEISRPPISFKNLVSQITILPKKLPLSEREKLRAAYSTLEYAKRKSLQREIEIASNKAAVGEKILTILLKNWFQIKFKPEKEENQQKREESIDHDEFSTIFLIHITHDKRLALLLRQTRQIELLNGANLEDIFKKMTEEEKQETFNRYIHYLNENKNKNIFTLPFNWQEAQNKLKVISNGKVIFLGLAFNKLKLVLIFNDAHNHIKHHENIHIRYPGIFRQNTGKGFNEALTDIQAIREEPSKMKKFLYEADIQTYKFLHFPNDKTFLMELTLLIINIPLFIPLILRLLSQRVDDFFPPSLKEYILILREIFAKKTKVKKIVIEKYRKDDKETTGKFWETLLSELGIDLVSALVCWEYTNNPETISLLRKLIDQLPKEKLSEKITALFTAPKLPPLA